jgi:nitroreductase
MKTGCGTEHIEMLERLLAARYSSRAFRPEPVPRATIERILSALQKTASWCNSQPWQVVIVSGDATPNFSRALYEAASQGAPHETDFPFPRGYYGVYLDRRRESGFQLYSALGIQRGDKAAYVKQTLENSRFFGAPHVAIITTEDALGVYGAIDCGAYVANVLLAAQAAGVASVPQAALASHSDIVRKHLGIGDDRRVVCGISFGFLDEIHPANSYRTNRAAIAEAVRFIDV